MANDNAIDLARELSRSIAEMRNYLRQYLQVKIKENNIEISFELMEVLGTLYRKDGINQQEIADFMVKDKSSMTYLIDSLVKRDMVRREEDENDRRNKLIFLTEKGRGMRETLNPWITEMHQQMVAGVKTTDLEKAIALVQRMNENMKK